MTTRKRLLSLAISLGLLAALIGAWKAYVEWQDVSKFVLPPPEDVASAAVDVLGDSRTWEHAFITLREILFGFAAATVLGVAVGTLIGKVLVLERALNPFLVGLQVLPKVAIIPLLLLWLGFGISAKVVVAATFAFFPITAATRAGIRSVDPGHRDLATTLGAKKVQRLVLLELPSALPSILTGMEVGIVLATIGAIVAEYLAGGEGLGWLATTYFAQLQVDGLFAIILLLCAMGFLLYAGVATLRRLVVPWHPSATTEPLVG
jgi:NitT/TauT family transport system permease protein